MYNLNFVIVIVFNCTHTYTWDYILVVYNITTLNLKIVTKKIVHNKNDNKNSTIWNFNDHLFYLPCASAIQFASIVPWD